MALACMETDVVLVQVADIYIGIISGEINTRTGSLHPIGSYAFGLEDPGAFG